MPQEASLQQKWDHGFGPLINGVALSDGTVYPFDVEVLAHGRGKFTVKLNVLSKYGLVGLTHETKWSALSPLAEAVSQDGTLKAISGEGAFGSEGFVALVEISRNDLRWIAVFDDSNPFDQVAFETDVIRARTTHGNEWLFPLDRPQCVVVDTE
jgi:hypothetical protein